MGVHYNIQNTHTILIFFNVTGKEVLAYTVTVPQPDA